MNRELLDLRLQKTFGGTPDERRIVVRQAGDLHDSGRYVETHEAELAVDVIVANLADAPDEYGLVERWNWWVGALDLAYGGYGEFRIRQWAER